jgi:hypothetical protein
MLLIIPRRYKDSSAVFQIRIRMFLGLLDLDPDPVVRSTDPDLSTINKNSIKTLFLLIFDFFMTIYLRNMK